MQSFFAQQQCEIVELGDAQHILNSVVIIIRENKLEYVSLRFNRATLNSETTLLGYNSILFCVGVIVNKFNDVHKSIFLSIYNIVSMLIYIYFLKVDFECYLHKMIIKQFE